MSFGLRMDDKLYHALIARAANRQVSCNSIVGIAIEAAPTFEPHEFAWYWDVAPLVNMMPVHISKRNSRKLTQFTQGTKVSRAMAVRVLLRRQLKIRTDQSTVNVQIQPTWGDLTRR